MVFLSEDRMCALFRLAFIDRKSFVSMAGIVDSWYGMLFLPAYEFFLEVAAPYF
jgi:hypothetical protein